MEKRVALETIKGMFSKIVYAKKYDEVEFIKEHDEEISMYRNLHTKELFHCKSEKIGTLEEAQALPNEDTTKEKTFNHSSRQMSFDEKQLSLFDEIRK